MSRFDQLDTAPYDLPCDVAARLLTPALVVCLDRVRENLDRVITYLDGDPGRWRPHVKTTKIPRVFETVAAAGVRSYKCATTREADWLLRTLEDAGVGDADLLVAYPALGPALARLAEIAARHPAARVSVLCETPDAIDDIPGGLGVFVDVNPGMNRTGIPLAREDAIIAVARRAGDRFRGVHFYEGHLHTGNAATRRAQAFELYDRLLDFTGRLAATGVRIEEIVTSGTPTFRAAHAHPGLAALDGTIHRVSPGTVVFHDYRSEQDLEEVDLVPAAVVLSRVISHPSDDIVTCDAGAKSIAAEAGDPCAYVLGRPDLVALTPSEEHLPLRVTDREAPERGTMLRLVPRHVCPTVNLAEEAILVEGGRITEVAPVSARAHDGQTA